MSFNLKNFIKGAMAVGGAALPLEERVLPIFITNPQSQKILGAVLVTETLFQQMFGAHPETGDPNPNQAPPPPNPVPAPQKP